VYVDLSASSEAIGVVAKQIWLATERATVRYIPSSNQQIAIVLDSIKMAGHQASPII